MSAIENMLFGMAVLLTHIIEGITGFGCTVLALPFCSALAGIKVAVPVLMIVTWFSSLYIMAIDWKRIVFRQLLVILMFVLLGLPIGLLLFSSLPERPLKILLGIFMICVSLRTLWCGRWKKERRDCPIETDKVYPKAVKTALYALLFFGGIIHGAFGSGGPFIVLYAAKALPDKSSFRSTICCLWLILNSIIILIDIPKGVITADVLRLSAWSLPFLLVGMIAGNLIHRRIKGDAFMKILYVIMLISGVFMLR